MTNPIASLDNAIRWLERNNIQVCFGVGHYYIYEVVSEGVLIEAEGKTLVDVTNIYRAKYRQFLEGKQAALLITVKDALYDGDMTND